MKLTPETYVARSKKMFERLLALVPAMMARIKPEVDKADHDRRSSWRTLWRRGTSWKMTSACQHGTR